ncbi:ferredoxin reductase family protein [Dactylosporangium sp. CA-092794]|uniref:ferredoxin reductase family protein n=1 Tax=Dactylosporangium sp. CA-092794 TaxID=3239929 RepID=UPI003D93ECC8
MREGFAVRYATAGAALLSVLVVIGLWLAGGGPQAASAAGGALTTAGRLTGLVGADLLLIQVLLMARVPWVERAYGQDALARHHRVVGFVSLWLMLAHVALIGAGYARSAGAGLLTEFWDLVTGYPGMLLATAGTVLLVAVAGLSVRAARRRLRYESWHLIHLYAYLGVGLALPHQLWTGSDFLATRVAAAYWWGLWGAAAAAVAVFRFGLPLYRSAYHRLRVETVVSEAPGVVSVYLRGRRLERLPARAGQFLLWRFLDGPGWTRAHPFTLSAAPRPDLLRITVKDLGDGSARIARLAPGTRVLVEGPYGALTAERRTRDKVLLVAAGVGITTMRALLDDVAPAAATTLLYRVRTPRDAVFRRELDSFAHHYGVRVVYLAGRRDRGGSWLPGRSGSGGDLAQLRRLVPDVADHEVFLCGPPSWMAAVHRTLGHAGVPAGRIHAERFAW